MCFHSAKTGNTPERTLSAHLLVGWMPRVRTAQTPPTPILYVPHPLTGCMYTQGMLMSLRTQSTHLFAHLARERFLASQQLQQASNTATQRTRFVTAVPAFEPAPACKHAHCGCHLRPYASIIVIQRMNSASLSIRLDLEHVWVYPRHAVSSRL